MVHHLPITALVVALLSALALSGCGEFPAQGDWGPRTSMDMSKVPDPIPRWEARSAYGNNTYQVSGVTYKVLSDSSGYVEQGLASWYGEKFNGQYTSNREIYNMYGMSAAHRTLPLPTYVRVTNLANNRSCIVRVNDRGPFHSDRLIDLSYAAASKLGIVETGTAMVEIRALDPQVGPDEPRISPVVVTAQPAFRSDAERPHLLPMTDVTPSVVTPAAAAAPKPTVAPSVPTAATTASSGIYVQAGAFASRENAERLRTRIKNEGKISASVQENDDGGKILYQVRVGPVASDAEAERIVTRLQALGIKSRVLHDK